LAEPAVGRQLPPIRPGRLLFADDAEFVVAKVLFAELVVTRVLSTELMVSGLLSTELVIDRSLPDVNRLLSTELVVDRPPSAVTPNVNTGLLCTKLVVSRQISFAELVVARVQVLSAELLVDRLFSTKLVVDRPLSDVNRLLPTELVVDRPPSAVTSNVDSRSLCIKLVDSRQVSFAELVVAKVLSAEPALDRLPSAAAPKVDYRVVKRATPIYEWPSSAGPGAAKSRDVHLVFRIRRFP
jgi:hypothetical protein